MKLDNPFSLETKLLFIDVHNCWFCNRNENYGKEAHHIYGRVSSSPVNCAILCSQCHSRIKHNDKEQQELLQITLVFLARINYSFTDNDFIFLSTIERDFMIVAHALL